MPEFTVSCAKIGKSTNGLDTLEGCPDILEKYSYVKFGVATYTYQLAQKMAEALLEELPQLILAEVPLKAVTIYKFTPSAAAALSHVVAAKLTEVRLERGLPPVELIHVKTDRVLSTNYAELSQKERSQYIADTGYHLPKGSVVNSNILVVDDIRITGTAEGLVRDLLDKQGHVNTIFGYLAMVEGALQPSIEHEINTYKVKGVDDLRDFIDDLEPVIRTIKLVLASDADTRRSFLKDLPDKLIHRLWMGAVHSGPDFIDSYSEGFDDLCNEKDSRLQVECSVLSCEN